MRIPVTVLSVVVFAALATPSCTIMPSLEISVLDDTGKPVGQFPLRIEASDGIQIFKDSPHGEKNVTKLEVVTRAGGNAVIPYYFKRSQPSLTGRLLFGRGTLPSQSFMVTPLRNLPAGSTITLHTANP